MTKPNEAYNQGLNDARNGRFPLYPVLLAAEQYMLAENYRSGYRVYQADPAKLRISGKHS